MYHRKLILVTVALILVAGSASASWTGIFETRSNQIEGGEIQANLVATRLSGYESTSPNWSLTGDELIVYTWAAQTEISAGAPVFVQGPSETSSSHGPFEAAVDELKTNSIFSVTPLASEIRISHVSSTISLAPADRATFSDGQNSTGGIENPRTESYSTANSTQSKSLGDWGSVSIEGNFKIHVYEVDWNITDANGTTTYKSGYEETPYVDDQPQPPIGHVGRTHYRDVYLYVTNGTLTMESLDEGQFEYFITNWTANAPNGIELQNTDGSLLGTELNQELDNSTIYLPGPATLSNGTIQDNQLSFSAFTSSDTVYIDGEAYTNPPPIIEPPIEEPDNPEPEATTAKKWGPDWWLTAGFGTFLLGVALAGIRFQKPFWYIRLEMRRGNHKLVAANAPRFFTEPRTRKKSVLIHSLALLGTGRFEEATEFIFSLIEQDRPDPATWNYLAAMALAGNGEFDEAKTHLTHCLRAAPQYIEEVERNPLLMRLLADTSEPGSEFA